MKIDFAFNKSKNPAKGFLFESKILIRKIISIVLPF